MKILLTKDQLNYPVESEWIDVAGFNSFSVKNLQIEGKASATIVFIGKKGSGIGEASVDKDRYNIPIDGHTLLKVNGRVFNNDDTISFDLELN